MISGELEVGDTLRVRTERIALIVVSFIALVSIAVAAYSLGVNRNTAGPEQAASDPAPEPAQETTAAVKKGPEKVEKVEREPVTFSGTGDSDTEPFTVPPGTYTVKADYEGTSKTGEWAFHWFTVRLKNIDDGDESKLPKPHPGLKPGIIIWEFLDSEQANTGYYGTQSVRFDEGGTYLFQIKAEGPWTLTIS